MKLDEFLNEIKSWDGASKKIFQLDLAPGESTNSYYRYIEYRWNTNLVIKLCYAEKVNLTFDVSIRYPKSEFKDFESIISLLNQVYSLPPTSSSEKKEPTPASDESSANESVRHELIKLIILRAVDKIDLFIITNYRKIHFDTPLKLSNDGKFSSIARLLYDATGGSKEYTEIQQKLIAWEQPYTAMASQLYLERHDRYFPREVVWTEELDLEYSARPRSGKLQRKPCHIPDPVDINSGLTLHETQLIEEAVFSRRRYGYSKLDNQLQETKTCEVDHLNDLFDYPWAMELPARNFIVANIGLVISKKYASNTDSFGKFITFPIEDKDYSLITQVQACSSGNDPHGEINLFTYMKSQEFGLWFVEKLKKYAESHKDEHNATIKCYAIVLDLHSTNTMCDIANNGVTVGCQAFTLNEQHAALRGNVNDKIKEFLQKAGYQVPKHGLLRMVTRVSAHQSGGWSRAHDKQGGAFYKFSYPEYKKDIRYLISNEAKQCYLKDGEKKKSDEKDSFSPPAPAVNALIMHQVNKGIREVLPKINKECKEITLQHTTIFKNRADSRHCKKTEFFMPDKLRVYKSVHLRDSQVCSEVKEPAAKKLRTC